MVCHRLPCCVGRLDALYDRLRATGAGFERTDRRNAAHITEVRDGARDV